MKNNGVQGKIKVYHLLFSKNDVKQYIIKYH